MALFTVLLTELQKNTLKKLSAPHFFLNNSHPALCKLFLTLSSKLYWTLYCLLLSTHMGTSMYWMLLYTKASVTGIFDNNSEEHFPFVVYHIGINIFLIVIYIIYII